MTELLHSDAIEGRWVLVLQGHEGLIVKPYLIEPEATKVTVQFVFGHGGQLVTGDHYSLHATLDQALAALRTATGDMRIEASIVIHSEGEAQLATKGFRL